MSSPVATQPSRWETRNQAFVSPQQLYQLENASKQRSRSPPASGANPPQSPLAQPQPQVQPNTLPHAGRAHTRTHSFFSSLKPKLMASNTPSSNSNIANGHKPQTLSVSSPNEFGAPNPTSPTLSLMPQNSQPQSAQRGQLEPPPLHPEIRSVVQLQLAHAHKVYFSGPLVRRIERLSDGQRPSKDEGWVDVWGQLGGTTLSVWDMKAVNEASKKGEEVPPSYINVTEGFVQVLGSVTIPPSPTVPPKKYTNVITLNTAGANLILFSCPDTSSLISWASALRLSAWEKSRLEEIYTAHLIRLSFNEAGVMKEPATPLVRGKLEGSVQVRIAGKTDWKTFWLVINAPAGGNGNGVSEDRRPTSPPNNTTTMKRMSSLFNRASSEQGASQPAIISLYSSNKGKDKKKPILTMRNITQAFAVYPERPDFIQRSTLIKIEGLIGDEEIAGAMKCREGWIFIMPDLAEGMTSPSKEMLKWVIALHDAFGLYGRHTRRQSAYEWDPRNPNSMMFSYPIGPDKDRLFLDRELAEPLDPRDDRTSAIRLRLTTICLDRMRLGPQAEQTPQQSREQQQKDATKTLTDASPQPSAKVEDSSPEGRNISQYPLLPPLDFGFARNPGGSNPPQAADPRPLSQRGASSLTPITERTTLDSNWPTETMETTVTTQDSSDRGMSISSLPPARSTGMGSGVLPPLRIGSDDKKDISNSRPDEGVLLIGETFSSSPVSDSEPPLPTPRPLSGQSFVPRGTFSNFSVVGDTHKSQHFSPNARPSALDSGSVDATRTRPPPSVSPSPPSESQSRTPSIQSPRFGNRAKSPSTQSTGSGSLRSGHLSPKSPLTNSLPVVPASENAPFSAKQSVSPPPSIQIIQRSTGSPLSPASRFSPPPPALHGQHEAVGPSAFVSSSPLISGRDELGFEPSRPPPSDMHVPSPTSLKNPHSVVSLSVAEASSDGESSNDDYHDEPQVVPVNALSPAPRKRSETPIMFDAPPETEGITSKSKISVNPDYRKAGLGRRPSGARAAPTKRIVVSDSHKDLAPVQDKQYEPSVPMSTSFEDPNADVLAALSFLQQEESYSQVDHPVQATSPRTRPVLAVETESDVRSSSSPTDNSPYRSSFALSKQAAERKARSQAAQAASQAAISKPGRPINGGFKIKKDRGAWESSEDEDEEDEEEEEGSDENTGDSRQDSRNHLYNAAQGTFGSANDVGGHSRPPRSLPAIPTPYPANSEQYSPSVSRRVDYDTDTLSRPTHHDEDPRTRPPLHVQERSHPEYAHQVPAGRQTVWSTVLDGNKAVQPPTKDTFVNLDEESQTMTKAFAPQGLLSAGLQDKQDRSAKRQEELARESGASLINVPSKPPPPQTGLLGAITGYERDRKREGGVGAALTERERERRLAEDRQRKLDEFQKQQLDQQQHMLMPGGNPALSMYGGQLPMAPYGNPMMGNPMMMGGNPMMGGFGFPGMMGGFGNPQQMFAAQQAAQAYQQAMMSFSTAGSQIGAEGGGPSPGVNPMAMGGMMGNPGFDPRMSMMSMGMGGWGDPRMSIYGPGMDFNGQRMQTPPLARQHLGDTFFPPQPTSQRDSTPPPRDSGDPSTKAA